MKQEHLSNTAKTMILEAVRPTWRPGPPTEPGPWWLRYESGDKWPVLVTEIDSYGDPWFPDGSWATADTITHHAPIPEPAEVQP